MLATVDRQLEEECSKLPARQRSICEGRAGLPLERVNAYRALWGLKPLASVQSGTVGSGPATWPARGGCGGCGAQRPVMQTATNGPGSLLARRLKKYGAPECDACRDLAARMDAWGPDGCAERMEQIVDEIVPRAQVWLASRRLIGALFTGAVGGAALRLAVRKLVADAIAEARKPPARPFRPRAWWSAFTPSGGTPRFITSSQLALDVQKLVPQLPPDVTAVIGVARSGLYPASLLSMLLHVPLIVLRHHQGDHVDAGHGWRLLEGRPQSTRKVVVVDDTTMTGNSVERSRHVLRDLPADKIYAAVYVNPAARAKPDIWAVDLPWPHLLEWNLFNSVMTPSMATDLDGVLCEDCRPEQDDDGARYLEFIRTARPKYLIRKCAVPLIVTARIEKYRAQTEEWLKRWNIRYNQLVMHPATTLAERNRDDIAAFKARHFQEWVRRARPGIKPVMFVESDPRQAQRIAELSRRLVVCPTNATCY